MIFSTLRAANLLKIPQYTIAAPHYAQSIILALTNSGIHIFTGVREHMKTAAFNLVSAQPSNSYQFTTQFVE